MNQLFTRCTGIFQKAAARFCSADIAHTSPWFLIATASALVYYRVHACIQSRIMFIAYFRVPFQARRLWDMIVWLALLLHRSCTLSEMWTSSEGIWTCKTNWKPHPPPPATVVGRHKRARWTQTLEEAWRWTVGGHINSKQDTNSFLQVLRQTLLCVKSGALVFIASK